MSRKSKKRRRKTERPPVPAKFFCNTPVRVKPGTKHPNFPDIPIGGWSGTIAKVEERPGPATYFIEWDQRTLDAMHPVYRNRCDRDALELARMWLDENAIEPDDGDTGPSSSRLRSSPVRCT
jgi:hypothetical protein